MKNPAGPDGHCGVGVANVGSGQRTAPQLHLPSASILPLLSL